VSRQADASVEIVRKKASEKKGRNAVAGVFDAFWKDASVKSNKKRKVSRLQVLAGITEQGSPSNAPEKNGRMQLPACVMPSGKMHNETRASPSARPYAFVWTASSSATARALAALVRPAAAKARLWERMASRMAAEGGLTTGGGGRGIGGGGGKELKCTDNKGGMWEEG
jgi:hypothetical protein